MESSWPLLLAASDSPIWMLHERHKELYSRGTCNGSEAGPGDRTHLVQRSIRQRLRRRDIR
jgi:hypothetical protein